MSGFFTLGGKDQEQDQGNQENSLFLFKNEEIYNKGFELWQQYYQLHQQQKLQLQDVDLSLVGGSASNYASTRRHTTTTTTTDHNDHTFPYRSSSSSGFGLHMRQSGTLLGNNSNNNNNNMIGGSSSSNSINCQDCGNQAKKDCVHMRCRTCCKSRGFPCQTHVKSTWVPAAKRREKQQQLHLSSSLQQQQQQQQQQDQQQNQLILMRGSDNFKRPRAENPLTCDRLPSHNSGLEVGQFPAEVTTSAMFRCVNVRAMDDAEEQYAYQAAVNIGGHVFKGLLYDQGPQNRYVGSADNSTGGAQQPLDLITAPVSTTTTTNPPGVTWLDSSTTYPTPLNAFMAGTQFFPPPRP